MSKPENQKSDEELVDALIDEEVVSCDSRATIIGADREGKLDVSLIN